MKSVGILRRPAARKRRRVVGPASGGRPIRVATFPVLLRRRVPSRGRPRPFCCCHRAEARSLQLLPLIFWGVPSGDGWVPSRAWRVGRGRRYGGASKFLALSWRLAQKGSRISGGAEKIVGAWEILAANRKTFSPVFRLICSGSAEWTRQRADFGGALSRRVESAATVFHNGPNPPNRANRRIMKQGVSFVD